MKSLVLKIKKSFSNFTGAKIPPIILLFASLTVSSFQSANSMNAKMNNLISQDFVSDEKTISIDERIEKLIKQLTLNEKLELLGGTGFATKPIARLGIPELKMADGPLGVRWGSATAFPSGIALAATWNPPLVHEVGAAIGREVKGKGRHILLAPCVNIARIPQGGRNFESFGEDPYLTSRMTVEYIKGVQSENVAATVKHFAVNNQEYQRLFVDVKVSERALNEIYLPSFKAAVEEADVLAVMSAYNKVNGSYCSENNFLLNETLKQKWGFKGLVMSDWGAVHSTIPTAINGLDLEMPFGQYLNPRTLNSAFDNGELTEEIINDKIRRLLFVMNKIGLLDNNPEPDESLINSKLNRDIAYRSALESIVLLKNQNNILPLDQNKIKSIAVIGPNAAIARTGGGGSSMVNSIDPVSPLDGLKNRLNSHIKINFTEGVLLEGDEAPIDSKYFFIDEKLEKPGLTGEYFNNINLEGAPKLKKVDTNINFKWWNEKPDPELENDNFSVRWTGYIKAPKTGEYTFTVSSDDGTRLYLDDRLMVDDWNDHAVEARSCRVTLNANEPTKIVLEYYEHGGDAVAILSWKIPGEDSWKNAIDAAKHSDVALIFAGTSFNYETEGRDREDLNLPNLQAELINEISEVNNSVVVILITGSPVLMNNWVDKTKGLVAAWFGGIEMGNAIADVILGNYNPSGKLPITFPKRWEDCSAYSSYKTLDSVTYYTDDIFVGYRHFDKNNIEPMFPFGFGLSYTNFKYENLNVAVTDSSNVIEVEFSLRNVGDREGTEVPQLYTSPLNPKIDRAKKELKCFDKIFLKSGEETKVKMKLDKEDFAYYDETLRYWKVDAVMYEILVGSSSRGILLEKTITLN